MGLWTEWKGFYWGAGQGHHYSHLILHAFSPLLVSPSLVPIAALKEGAEEGSGSLSV